jgi:hypothetical protein
MTQQMMARFYLRCLSLTPQNLLVIPSSWIRKTSNDIMHKSSMISLKRRFCKCIGKHELELFRQPGHVQFVCSINDDNYEEILSYNELMDYIEKDKKQHQDKDGNGF